MKHVLNLSVTAEDNTLNMAVEQVAAVAMTLVKRVDGMTVTMTSRTIDPDEEIEEEPDWEKMYNDLRDAINEIVDEWSMADQKYKQRLAVQLRDRTIREL